MLNDQAQNLEGSELRQIADQIMMYLFYNNLSDIDSLNFQSVLERIQTRTRLWSNYNSVTTFCVFPPYYQHYIYQS